ncbi:ISL3 family transposase [Pediococcus inopinatus]|uniref:ISL3 family transposase n=6 Tax=Pediococcus TaxID=1253 RepID=A0ABZ0Q303_9LACO|nr:ISL3 family transposase [Pediococcus inopinatus]WPC17157.1 ISL3 family transposase [Pediococcus inopinatus]WPC18181.1 ISL3 family transposase [Pediococcus inopinatus]WPC18260.1 ISL3 family transposase [Pediococcus inopinatus]WPC19617.1 ISL3 family transposase [Pediococcus inopinatus]WPC19658.1 ISL3 family transposase [Pediococcus inopinatus]
MCYDLIAKQNRKEEKQMSLTNSILSLFEMTDPNITVTGVTKKRCPNGQRIHVVHANLSYQLVKCPHCGHKSLIKNGTHVSHLRLGTLSGGRYEMQLRRQRYQCQHCLKTCGAKTNLVRRNETFTHNVKHQVIVLARDMLTSKEIAKICGISPSSVQRILNANIHLAYRVKQLPPNLCFDEFRSCNHLMSFNCCDAVSHRRIVTLEDRLSKDIIDYFEARYSVQERAKVQTITIDMNAEYASFIHRLFPNAVTIIDRFHIIQLAGRALDNVRTRIIRTFQDKHSRIYRILKSQWRLFHLAEEKINDTKLIYLRGINEYMTQQNAIDLALDEFPEFKTVYQTYQGILTAIHQKNATGFKNLITNYQVAGNQMDVTISTFVKNGSAVLNSCRYPYSNGPIEGLNRKIKVLKRSCFGFRNIHNFFIRISLIHE